MLRVSTIIMLSSDILLMAHWCSNKVEADKAEFGSCYLAVALGKLNTSCLGPTGPKNWDGASCDWTRGKRLQPGQD